MEKSNFMAFKEADIKICNLLPKNIIGPIFPSERSIGLSYLPPLFAERLNLYAENGSTILSERPLEFYFNTLEGQEADDILDLIQIDIMDIALPATHPYVCVFIPPVVAYKLIALISEPGMLSHWDERLVSKNSKLYDIYLDENNMPRAQIIRLFSDN